MTRNQPTKPQELLTMTRSSVNDSEVDHKDRHMHVVQVASEEIMDPPLSTLLRIRKSPRSNLTIRDTQPVLWRQSDEEDDVDDHRRFTRLANKNNAAGTKQHPLDSDGCCQVCKQNKSRYSCPKCNIRYCSVDCYRNHNNSNSQQGGSSPCTEQFYQTRVNQVIQLEANERREETKQLLNRIHQQDQDGINSSTSSDILDVVQKDDLVKLLKVLDDDGDDQTIDRLLERYPAIRTALDHAILNGELQDWVLEPWKPWWRPSLVSKDDNDDDVNTSDDDDSTDTGSSQPTLDEQLLQVPPLSSLLPASSKSAVPALEFNLIDIVYSIALTLRLYHGRTNACETAFAAALTLLKQSHVLSQDARFTGLAEVMVSSVTASSRVQSDHPTSWDVFAHDVALLCQNRRLVGRALLEANDIVKAAMDDIKKQRIVKDLTIALRRSRKKLDFYLSWSRVGTMPTPADIQDWVSNWRLSEPVTDVKLPRMN